MQTSEYYEDIYLLESTCGINFIIPELRTSFLKTYVIVTTSASWDQRDVYTKTNSGKVFKDENEFK